MCLGVYRWGDMRSSWRSLQFFILFCLVVYGVSYLPIAQDVVRLSTAPLVQFTRRIGESVIENIRVVFMISTLSKENGALRAKVNELSAISIVNNELKHENELLRKELSLAESNATLIAAQVISRNASVSQQALVVNKGKKDGFSKGMAIIAQGYLIGRVQEANEATSQILLLTSSESLLPVVLQNSRSVGVLRGGTAGLTIDDIPRDIAITLDEAVVTSNVGDVVKSGIPVGKVTSVISGKSDVFQSASVALSVDLSRLEVVFGVKN
jgi:rod shape-determining protein MreC